MAYTPMNKRTRSKTRTVKKLYLFPWRLKGQWKKPGAHKVVQEYRERFYSHTECSCFGRGLVHWETIEWATEQNQIIKKVKAGERLEEGGCIYLDPNDELAYRVNNKDTSK